MRRLKAFSLMELLCVIVILGILFSLGMPKVKNFIELKETESLQKQLLDVITFAQSEAHIQHSPIGLCLSDDKKHCQDQAQNNLIVFKDLLDDEGGQENISYADEIIAIIQIPTQKGILHFRSFPFYRHFIRIKPDILQSDNSAFWYCLRNHKNPTWAITINKSGRARIISSNKTVGIDKYWAC